MLAAVVKSSATQICRGAVRSSGRAISAKGSFKQSIKQTRLAGGVQQSLVARRWHSSPSDRSRQYEFEDIRKLSTSPSDDRVIIDVREPSEYADGYIPGAVNIPVKSQPDAIFLPEEEFEDRFGFSKPSEEKEVIFYCRSGVRSSAAARLAQQQGYKNISEYRGSWLDWEKHGGPVNKP